MSHGVLWDPKDAGYSLTYVAKYLLDGGSLADLKEIPGIGAVVVDGDVIKVDAMADITKENVDSFGF